MHTRSSDHILPHSYNAGTEHVGLSPTRQLSPAPTAKHREVWRGIRRERGRGKGGREGGW